ncbi:unnamed protein product [Caenorhabditis auriculariae]|uniref:Protein root UVB sensitive/RUS domain-containing protein n=1 Tax=Caenorhabditis auriculariae TaxID=2777116 RepID=A0A8S1HDX8_9PELO|nr:unnamed protein product [Caenorhabditis auriculariae]
MLVTIIPSVDCCNEVKVYRAIDIAMRQEIQRPDKITEENSGQEKYMKSSKWDHYTDHYNGKPVVETPTKCFAVSSIRDLFIAVFLPQGFPGSVSRDYVDYQIWDTLQALCSSLTGALATEAVLTGAGVGRETSTPLAAAMTWLIKDGLGMIGRITFSYFKGSALDYDCKKWRLVADILNDASFFIDLLNTILTGIFLPLACISSVFRCIVGVAGGATRATIVQHQAQRNNLADVAAKDGSQETLVNVVALLTSLLLLPIISGNVTLVWSLFLIFTISHIYANYRAVRSLNITTLNKKRATITIREFMKTGFVPTVKTCNEQEPLFYDPTGRRHLGVKLSSLPKHLPKFEDDFHVIAVDARKNEAWVALRNGSPNTSSRQQLYAFFSAEYHIRGEAANDSIFGDFLIQLQKQGYQTDVHYLVELVPKTAYAHATRPAFVTFQAGMDYWDGLYQHYASNCIIFKCQRQWRRVLSENDCHVLAVDARMSEAWIVLRHDSPNTLSRQQLYAFF